MKKFKWEEPGEFEITKSKNKKTKNKKKDGYESPTLTEISATSTLKNLECLAAKGSSCSWK